MPVTATTLKLLLDNGIQGDALVAVVTAIDADFLAAGGHGRLPIDGQAERRRAADRDYQAKRRAEKQVAVAVPSSDPSADSSTNLHKESLKPLSEEKDSLSENGESADSRQPNGRHAYSPAFESFWSSYPTDAGMSKLEAWQAWRKLSDVDQAKAAAAVPAFRAWIGKQAAEYRVVHACRFLSRRWFDGFVDRAANGATHAMCAYPTKTELAIQATLQSN